MNFKYKYYSVIIVFSLLTLVFVGKVAAEKGPPKSVFGEISLSTAKEMAAAEGKMIFLDFYASWCVPCKWMDETTFADKDVQFYLKDNYITLRVDIDDFDGFAVKEHYNVRVLPTMLILDRRGMTVERKEESLSPKEMLELLKNHQSAEVVARVNSSPSKKNKKNGNLLSSKQNGQQPVKEEEVNHATVETTTYRVQVGVFTDYANTQKMVEDIRELTDEPIVVLNDYLNDKTVFKVMVGVFENRESANKFKNQLLQNYGINGYVK